MNPPSKKTYHKNMQAPCLTNTLITISWVEKFSDKRPIKKVLQINIEPRDTHKHKPKEIPNRIGINYNKKLATLKLTKLFHGQALKYATAISFKQTRNKMMITSLSDLPIYRKLSESPIYRIKRNFLTRQSTGLYQTATAQNEK